MSKETAKWHIGMRSGANANTVYDRSGDNQHEDLAICQVYGITHQSDLEEVATNPRCKEGYEKARLIAAAPELLSALELVRAQENAILPAHVWMSINAALSKATGEES